MAVVPYRKCSPVTEHLYTGPTGEAIFKINRHKCWGNLAMQQVTLAASTLLEYALGLRPQPTTPGTHRVWGTYALLCLAHLPFLQKCWVDWLCSVPLHLSLANWLTTLSACSLDHIQPETHRVQRPPALLLLLEAGLPAKRPHCKEWVGLSRKENSCFQLHIYAALSYFRSYSRPHTPGTHHFLEHPRPAGFAALQTAFLIESR